MKKYITIGETAEILGVSVSTMRRWEREGKLSSDKRTMGMHRRYEKEKIIRKGEKDGRMTVGYARVSSYDQKEDLERQANVLEKSCKEEKVKYEIIKDLGSGLNFKKKGLKRLIQLIINSKLDKIYITHKDRLLRFGSELIISIAKEFGTEVIIMDEVEKTFEMELAGDVLEIITVFSAKLYGKRSHKNKEEKKICM